MLAEAGAVAFSGYKKGAAKSASSEAASAATAEPITASPTAAPQTMVQGSPFYINKALNELAIEARRAKITLSPIDYNDLVTVVKAGATPKAAVEALASTKSPSGELAKRLGTPSDADVAASVSRKNATGSR